MTHTPPPVDVNLTVELKGKASTAPALDEAPPKKPLEDVEKIAGLVVTAFVGAAAFVGLKDAELSTVLRNEPTAASVVALMLAGAVACALVSIFVRSETKTSIAIAALLVGAALALPALISRWLPLPPPPDQKSFFTDLAGIWIVACGAVVLFAGVHLILNTPSRRVPVQAILLVLSAVLAAGAIYTALRLETRSQLQTARPQVGATMKVTTVTNTSPADGVDGNLTISVKASRLRDGERIGLQVRALPRNAEHVCDLKPTTSRGEERTRAARYYCDESPCDADFAYRTINAQPEDHPNPCELLSSAIVGPDATGNAVETFAVPFQSSRWQRIGIFAQLCRRLADQADDRTTAEPETGSTTRRPEHPCKYEERITQVNFRVP